jgi:single-strand DNA-binding protein
LSLNQATIMGRLARDPELRRTQSGIAVVSFTLAVDQDYTNDRGERGCDFIPVVAWRQTAEFVSKYFTKGRMAVASGRIQVRNYIDKDGNKRTATEIVAYRVYFGESKRDRDEEDYARAEREGKTGRYEAKAPVPVEVDEDEGDFPF